MKRIRVLKITAKGQLILTYLNGVELSYIRSV